MKDKVELNLDYQTFIIRVIFTIGDTLVLQQKYGFKKLNLCRNELFFTMGNTSNETIWYIVILYNITERERQMGFN